MADETSGAASVAELLRDLSRPGACPRGRNQVSAAPVQVVQTHISLVFLAGDRVYKVKKPVRFPFLDFSTVELRRRFCREEVRLNRRLAPGWYLGVSPVLRGPDGRLCFGEPVDVEGGSGDGREPATGEAVDWAVAMVRLPADRMLESLLDRGELDNGVLNRLAALLADFHREAPGGPEVTRHGTPTAVRELVLGNLGECAGLPVPGPSLHAFLTDSARAFLDREQALLERRVREGRIRDGHGDLHASNICFPPGGPAIYDCIEFSAAFRCGDVALDLAFLVMDLDLRGYPAFGGYLVHRYVSCSGDRELPRLMNVYRAHRAVVRGKVACLRAADTGVEEDLRAAARREATSYFQLAVGYWLQPTLVLLCGLPATGKSWVGPALVRALRGSWLRSDVRRKVLAGVRPTDHSADPAELYDEAMTRRTYESLLEQAARLLEAGSSVVVDATFSRAEHRRVFVAAAERAGRPWLLLHLSAEEPEIARRMAARATDAGEVSDADLAVYRRARESFEDPDELPAERVVAWSERAAEPEEVVAAVLERLAGP